MSAVHEYVGDPDSRIDPRIGSTVSVDAHHLWAQLPAGVAEAFEPHVRTMTEYVLREIQRSVPEYAATDSMVERLIVKGVGSAITRCLTDMRDEGTGERDDWRSMFVWLGRNEFAEGRSLDCLQSAYRVAGRAAWHYLSEFSRELDLPAELLCLAAEAVFATIDDISALSVDGYAEAKGSAAGAAERQRSRLLTLLLSDPPPAAAAVAVLAKAAGWTVPEHVRVVALTPVEEGLPTGFALDRDVLRELDGPRPCLLTGCAETHLARLEARLGGRRAAIGPRVPVTQAAASFACARRALDLVAAGVLPDEPVVRCEDHLMSMLLVSDPFLGKQLADQVLAPFGEVSARRMERLGETLLAWLQHSGNVVGVAESLQVHPQTVRYRLNQLGELFGDRLADPEWRLAAEVALRAGLLLKLWDDVVDRQS